MRFLITPLVFLLVTLTSIVAQENQPLRIVIIGDSTVATYPDNHVNRGWGQYIDEFFKENSVEVFNHARSGRSSKTFIQENLWRAALTDKPNIVLIQFGHNDSHAPENNESTAADGDFKEYLRQYIQESQEYGAIPVLVTPMVRRSFNAIGQTVDAKPPSQLLSDYAAAMLELGTELKIPVIDLYASSLALAEKIGAEESMKLASQDGDQTHFNEKGARTMAALVMEELLVAVPSLKPSLRGYNAGSRGRE